MFVPLCLVSPFVLFGDGSVVDGEHWGGRGWGEAFPGQRDKGQLMPCFWAGCDPGGLKGTSGTGRKSGGELGGAGWCWGVLGWSWGVQPAVLAALRVVELAARWAYLHLHRGCFSLHAQFGCKFCGLEFCPQALCTTEICLCSQLLCLAISITIFNCCFVIWLPL